MSFLSTYFQDDKKTLSIIRKTKTKNDIGEVVDAEEAAVTFTGIILRIWDPWSGFLIEKNIPIDEVTHTLRCELDVSIKRDDIIIDGTRRFIAKHLSLQEDFGGTYDHQLIHLKHYE